MRFSSTITVVLAIVILSGSAARASDETIQWAKTHGYTQQELFPIDIGKYGYPYVTVRVNGHDLVMAVDTANMTGLLVSTEIAESLGLPVTGKSTHYDSDGSVAGKFNRYRVDTFEMFNDTWTGVDASEIKRNDVAGYVGPRFFQYKRFTLDYRNKTIAVSASEPPQGTGNVLPMIRSPEHEGLILVWGYIKRRPVLIQIDTGKSRTCVDPRLAEELDLPEVPHGYHVEGLILGGRSFSVRSAKEVGFQGISEGLPAPILVAIGSDIISQIILTVDYARRRIVIGE